MYGQRFIPEGVEMTKVLIAATILWIIGAVWVSIELINHINKWIKEEREEILKDE